MNPTANFGQWIKRLRARQDFTQEKLAEEVACSVQTIRAFESGTRRPSREMAERLAGVLHVAAGERAEFLAQARGLGSAEPAEHPGAAAPAPAGTPSRPRFRPPAPLTPLIGRSADLQELQSLFLEQQIRLVTLVGPGGVGKTRIAQQAAYALASAFDEGALFIPLAQIADPYAIPAAVAAALGASVHGAQTPEQQLDELLAGRSLLLVLDNFEHLLDETRADTAVALVEHILASAEGISLLVTSRERLRVYGERLFELLGLAAPHLTHTQHLDEAQLATYDAVILFLARARNVSRQFALDASNLAQVARICALLQGMPLAIELVASWVRTLSPHEIVAEIERSIDFLAAADRSLPARHRSMRAVFDHSWSLLTPSEQMGIASLSVFRGGFDREAAQQVAGVNLGMLAALVDKSLVMAGGAIPKAGNSGAQRYTIHELARHYLYLRLCEQGAAATAHRRHAHYFEQLAQRVAPHLFASDTIEWRHALEVEQGNLESALHWCTDERNDPQMGLRLAAVLGRFWYLAEQWMSGAAALRRALAAAGSVEDSAGDTGATTEVRTTEALAYARLGELYHALSDHDASAECFDQSLARWRTLADPSHLAWTLFQRGSLASSANRREEAQSFFAESLAQYRRLNNRLRVATVLSHQGSLAITNGQYAYAAQTLEECQRLFRELNHRGSLLVALNLLGRARLGLGEVEAAILYFHEALDIGRERKAQEGMAWALINLGIAHATVETFGAALGYYRQALDLYLKIQRGGGIMATIEGVAAAYAHYGRSEEAVKLLAAADRLCRELQQALTAQEVAIQQRAFARTRATLTAEQWQRAWQAGDRLGVEQAVALALGSPGSDNF